MKGIFALLNLIVCLACLGMEPMDNLCSSI
jgi:hypothetical protein